MQELVGNESRRQFLQNMIDKQKVTHSYLFYGIEGIGKTIFAREFAKTLLCDEKQNKPCEKCSSCQTFVENNHPDFMQIEPDGKTIKIEQIRNLQEKIAEKPIRSNYKIYIIKDADTMTKEAQNSLLKTLEEPPSYAVLILVASNENRLLNTILSRCIKISFLPIENNVLKEYMQTHYQVSLSENELAVCAGSVGRAISIQQRISKYRQLEEVLKNIETKDILTVFKESEFLYKEKEDILDLLDYMLVVLYHSNNRKKKNAIFYVEDTKHRLLANSNYDMTIDYLWIRIWEEIHEKYNRC